jgi:transposase
MRYGFNACTQEAGMKRYVEGTDRSQGILFPEQLDDYVGEDNIVRVVDAFLEALDLYALGFAGAEPSRTGRPAYHPAVLLGIYIYGYLNRIQSSRRLEREAQRNVELMWLTGRLAPDFKTIADFRKNNGDAICQVCRQFVKVCRRIGMFSDSSGVAIDGSKFKAVNNRDKNFTNNKLQARIEQLEEGISRYMEELDRADRDPALVPDTRVANIKEKIAALKGQIDGLAEIDKKLKATPDQQISLTDPDARSMSTTGRGTATVGYNVQTAVDTQHHLIVAHEVTNVGHDRTQLASMAQQANEVLRKEGLLIFADRGYFSGPEILACEELGVIPLVPKSLTSGNRAKGQFDKRDFRYLPESDEFQCPAGERAIWRMSVVEKGLVFNKYWSSACPKCLIKSQCTTGVNRRITRWEHEDTLDRMQQRLATRRDTARVRRRTVEHPFGTLKSWMGATHFLTKTFPRVRTEMSLHVLAYNLKRVMNIMGIAGLKAALNGL